jgi:hypothetical protein
MDGVSVRGWEYVTDRRDLVPASYHVAVLDEEGWFGEVSSRRGGVMISAPSAWAVRGWTLSAASASLRVGNPQIHRRRHRGADGAAGVFVATDIVAAALGPGHPGIILGDFTERYAFVNRGAAALQPEISGTRVHKLRVDVDQIIGEEGAGTSITELRTPIPIGDIVPDLRIRTPRPYENTSGRHIVGGGADRLGSHQPPQQDHADDHIAGMRQVSSDIHHPKSPSTLRPYPIGFVLSLRVNLHRL